MHRWLDKVGNKLVISSITLICLLVTIVYNLADETLGETGRKPQIPPPILSDPDRDKIIKVIEDYTVSKKIRGIKFETNPSIYKYLLDRLPLATDMIRGLNIHNLVITKNKDQSFHFKDGDNTQDLSGRFYYPFAGAKIAIEVYGVMLEHYSMSDAIRDERVARDKDARGLAIGDLYFSSMIQLLRDRKFPDTVLRLACKTASGGRLDAARYADSPGYFLDLNFSKNLSSGLRNTQWVPFGMLGFYSWQTNDDMNLQDDALLYGAGMDIRFKEMTVSNSLSGYHGYKDNGDRPIVYTFDLQKKLKHQTFRIQYLYGLHDWIYQTVKLSYIWKWD